MFVWKMDSKRKRVTQNDKMGYIHVKRAPKIDHKTALLDAKKTAKQKGLKYHGLTRRIKEIWSQHPESGHSCATNTQWCGYRDAVAHGNAVDVEVSAYVKLGYKEFIKQKGSTVDKCTLAVIQFLKQKKLTPLLSQYIMYDSETLVKTHLDVLAEDSNHELVLIELKATINGDHESYYASNSNLQLSGGSTLPNSYYNRNMIQLLMMLKILYLRYGILVKRGYVVRVGGSNLWSYPMDSTVLALNEDIYSTFVEKRSSVVS